MKLRKLIHDTHAAVEILYYVITIFVCGALYSLLFIGIAFCLKNLVPDSDTKTLMMMFMYGLMGIILVVGVIALIIEGIKRNRNAGF
jgi:hypothetical protein